jgi:hypothetical protein
VKVGDLQQVIDEPARRAEVSAVELAETFLARIEEYQPPKTDPRKTVSVDESAQISGP